MLKQRVITAVVLAVLAAVALFKSTELIWQWIVLLIGFIAAWEWAGLARLTKVWQKIAFALLVLLLSWISLLMLSVQGLVFLTVIESILLMSVVFRYQQSKALKGPRFAGFILMSGVLSIVVFTVALIHFRDAFSPQVILLSLLVIWAIDTGAYFTGKRFGKTKLAPYVSPGKTWEGVWGGVLLAFIVAWLSVQWLQVELSVSAWLFALVLAFIALFSVLGDLFESVLKRQAGVKDSSHLLPGHGGVLDRIDSLLIALPMMYLLWHFGSMV